MYRTIVTTSGVESLCLMDDDGRLDYTIRVQNTVTDTAFFVVIKDTLQATLDPATLELGAASHGMSMVVRDNVLLFMFPNILWPDSNTNEPRSHGFVTYSIEPRQPVLPGTVIENTANIYFDFNPPIITEPSVLVAEFSTGVGVEAPGADLFLYPNPAMHSVSIGGMRSTEQVTELRLLAVDGRILRIVSTRGTSPRMEVADLSARLYLLEAVVNASRSSTMTFIKP